MKKEDIIRISEDLAFVLVIALSIFDFFEMLPPEVDYFQKILSWTMMGYLFYRASLTKLFFGVQKKFADGLLILTYFLFITPKVVGYAMVASREESLLSSFFLYLANPRFEVYSFYIGGVLLIIFSLYLIRIPVKRPSLMHVIHEAGAARTLKKKAERFIATYMVLVAFFVLLFNQVMEWIAMILDKSLLMAGIFLYIYIIVSLHKRFSAETLIHKIGSFGEDFYNSFIQLFHTKKRILLGVSGLVILFMLVDVGNFVLPFIIELHDPIYFTQLGSGQEDLATLITRDMGFATTLLSKVSLACAYLSNILAMLFFLALPAFVWYKVYRRKGFKVTNLSLSLFFISVAAYIISPIFRVEPIKDVSYLVGVIIKTNTLMPSNIALTFLASLIIGLAIFFLSRSHWIKEKLMILAIILLIAFFTVYIAYYFYSMCLYYLSSIAYFISEGQTFFVFYFTLFWTILALFFVSGLIIYLSEIKREFRYIR